MIMKSRCIRRKRVRGLGRLVDKIRDLGVKSGRRGRREIGEEGWDIFFVLKVVVLKNLLR